MNEPIGQHFLLPPGVPTVALWLATLLLFAGWIRLRPWTVPSPPSWMPSIPVLMRIALCFAALLALSQAFQRHLVFATSWAIWPICLAGAVAVETALLLYAFELRSVPKREGEILASLRASLVLLVAFALCQPVRTFELSRKIDRHVAVLLDSSASMDVPDTGMSPAERVRLSETLAILKTPRPLRAEELVSKLRSARQETMAQADGLSALPPMTANPEDKQTGRLRNLVEGASRVRDAIAEVSKSLSDAAEKGAQAVSDPLKQKLKAIAGRVTSDILPRLDDRLKLLEAGLQSDEKRQADKAAPIVPLPVDQIAEGGKRAADLLQEFEKEVAMLGDEMDTSFHASLSEAEKAAVDACAAMPRREVAEKLLSATGPQNKDNASHVSLLQQITENYGVKAYTFDSAAAEKDPATITLKKAWPTDPMPRTASALKTNIAAALEKAMADIPPNQLAGVVLLSDGRHNAAESVESAAANLGKAGAPVCVIAIGATRRPPKDAAVVDVNAPDKVFLQDRLRADIDVKLDNLSGSKVVVKLMDGKEMVDSKTLDVKSDAVRERIQLSDMPKTVGYHAYRVVIDPLDGEVEKDNNERAIPVNATDDRIKVLYVEGRPRWEFRYLKNLFVNRDPSVRLQYVLLHPDTIDGQPPHPAIAASASRPVDSPEATALPASAEEWMKFDVILLGDVSPAELGHDAMVSLRRFVSERGGALAVIAGPSYMPRAYTDTPLAELIPAEVKASDLRCVKAPEESFHVAVTQEGREHVITRLAATSEESLKAWSEQPPWFWRHPIVRAKPGAAVLAYAMPFAPPPFMKIASASEIPDEQTMRQRRQFELENALVVCQNYSLGRVLFLASDETWRLRYRTGDTFHHKFWGQLLRWATADKIMFGSACVRLAADRSRYSVDEPVRIRARLARPDFSPVMNAAPAIKVMRGEREVARKKLVFEPGSPGVYSGEIGKLPEGDYRILLETQGIPAELAAEADKVAAEFGVAEASPMELTELSADLGTLNRIAALSGGIVVEPSQARLVADRFGPPSLIQSEIRQISLWNSWLFLAALITLAACEWLLRKKVSLP